VACIWAPIRSRHFPDTTLKFMDLLKSVRNVLLHWTKTFFVQTSNLFELSLNPRGVNITLSYNWELFRLSLYFTEDRDVKNLRNVSSISLLHE
jgi:hypothetical protein